MTDTDVLPDKITINLLDSPTPKTLLMSFGLLNRLAAYIHDPQQLQNIYLVPEIADVFIFESLIERDKEGHPLEKFSPNTFGERLHFEDAERLLKWCEGHLTAFFSKRLQAAVRVQEKILNPQG